MKLYQHKNNFQMNDAIVENFIKQYIQSQPTNTVHFLWQGGETTLRKLEFFKNIVELQQKYAGNKQINNELQTNGTPLDDHWCNFFLKPIIFL